MKLYSVVDSLVPRFGYGILKEEIICHFMVIINITKCTSKLIIT